MEDKKKYEKGSLAWLRKQQKINAKKDGFDNIDDWLKWKNRSLEDRYGIEFSEWAKQNKDSVPKYYLDAGCKNRTEYGNYCARRLGYKDEEDRQLEMLHNKGIVGPMSENEDCSYYFGTFIGEELFRRFLSKIFEYVKGFHPANESFDFECENPRREFMDKYPQLKLARDKKYVIQLKLRCFRHKHGKDWLGWLFTHIDYNNIPDYFILCGWDDRESLQPMHIWIFHRDDMVRKGHHHTDIEKFWKRSSITITNTQTKLKEFEKYELVDELYKLKEIFEELKDDIL